MDVVIPIHKPDLGGNEAAYVIRCIERGWISGKGSFVTEFEQRFSEAVGVRHAAAVCNGTAALHLALLACGLGPGDEVVVPSLTYVAAVNAVTYVGATPVLADSHAETWQIDPADVERCITPRTRAIIAVHLYGQSCDMDPLCDLAARHGLALVEDCAEAFGTSYRGRHVGAFGDVAAFSFYGNKTVTTGEGGMVVTRRPDLHRRVMHLRGQGLAMGCEYWHDVVGYNYRMSNVHAAIGVAQLERAGEFLAKKRAIASMYQEALAELPVTLHGEQAGTVHSYWVNSIGLHDPAHRDPLRRSLRDRGIETRPVFFPVHTMPVYARFARPLPVAERLARAGVNLPSWPGLSADEVGIVAEGIRRYFATRG